MGFERREVTIKYPGETGYVRDCQNIWDRNVINERQGTINESLSSKVTHLIN